MHKAIGIPVLFALASMMPLASAAEFSEESAGSFSGQEFRINTFEPGDQRVPLVASTGDGRSVVVWQSRNQTAPGWAIYAQRLDAQVALVGDEIQVNDFNTGSQDGQSLVMAPDGSFAVAWNGQDRSSEMDVISVRRFGADGMPLASDRRISETTGEIQLLPRLGLTDDNQLVISWEQSSEATGFDILSRRADATGSAVGPIASLNVSSSGAQRRADLAVGDDGSVVAVWQDALLDGSDWGVFLRCLDSAGQGPAETQVNQFTNGQQLRPRVARADDGRFAVVWQDTMGLSSFDYRRIMARLFDPSCQPLGPELQVNQFDDAIQDQPAIAVDGSGNYVLAWQSFPEDFERQGIYARRLGRDGQFISDEFRVSQELEAFQDFPSVSVLDDDGYLFAWESAGQDESGFGIFARRFAGPLGADLRVLSGAGQVAPINEPFEQALRIEVLDQWGQVRINEPVRISSFGDSAGVLFANGQPVIEAQTNELGQVAFEMTANSVPGEFVLRVETPRSGEQQEVALENLLSSGRSAPIPVPTLGPLVLLILILLTLLLGRTRLC